MKHLKIFSWLENFDELTFCQKILYRSLDIKAAIYRFFTGKRTLEEKIIDYTNRHPFNQKDLDKKD